MRRLAWELRVKYPTLIMKKYNEQSARNIQKLYDITHGQILIFADSNNIEIEEVKNLQFELKRMGFAFLICYIERKLKGIPISGAAIYTVVKLFDTSETIDMKSRLTEYTDGKEVLMKLDSIVAEKPAFSPLITKLIEEHRASDNGQYSGENDAIVRIFNKLAEVYPEEAHFAAHLARYYFYIDRNFEKGFKNIDYVMELSETMYGYIDRLCSQKLVEGRLTSLYLSASVAKSIDESTGCIKNKGFDDKYYKDLIVEYLKQYGKAKKKDIRELLWDKLPDALSDVQKENKIRNMLTMLKKQGIIDKIQKISRNLIGY